MRTSFCNDSINSALVKTIGILVAKREAEYHVPPGRERKRHRPDVGGDARPGGVAPDGYNARVTDRVASVRPAITARRFSSNAEADRHDAEFWQRMPRHERVLLTWRLSVEQWELLGRAPDEPGLCRSVASVRGR
jgi:hypothetical protein